jgi:hypothetical protein
MSAQSTPTCEAPAGQACCVGAVEAAVQQEAGRPHHHGARLRGCCDERAWVAAAGISCCQVGGRRRIHTARAPRPACCTQHKLPDSHSGVRTSSSIPRGVLGSLGETPRGTLMVGSVLKAPGPAVWPKRGAVEASAAPAADAVTAGAWRLRRTQRWPAAAAARLLLLLPAWNAAAATAGACRLRRWRGVWATHRAWQLENACTRATMSMRWCTSWQPTCAACMHAAHLPTAHAPVAALESAPQPTFGAASRRQQALAAPADAGGLHTGCDTPPPGAAVPAWCWMCVCVGWRRATVSRRCCCSVECARLASEARVFRRAGECLGRSGITL